ncbi:MAG: hypothetical protein Q9202_000636 [Teloschistes flavicans]
MAAPYEYEDVQEAQIKSLETLNNKYDPTGKLNEIRLPPLRRRQEASRPRFYVPSQHSSSARLSVTIHGPETMRLDSPFPITLTLHHRPNPTGNPLNQPVTLRWQDTALHEIIDTEISPWMFLQHAEDGKLKELDDGDNGPGFAQMQDAESGALAAPEISAANGFFSLGIDERKVAEVEFMYSGDGLQLLPGGRYSIGFKGSRVHWWRWGSLEDLEGQRREGGTSEDGFVTIPASNLIEVVIAGDSKVSTGGDQ